MGDIAGLVVETLREAREFVRSNHQEQIAFIASIDTAANVMERMQWRSYLNEAPRGKQWCLVVSRNASRSWCEWYDGRQWSGDAENFVSHWMLLPPPPED